MPVLGTKKFWRPAQGATATQKENQILKNSGYVNLQLRAVNFMSKGNFFQNIFGGYDTIALATNIKFQSGTDQIEASIVQDVSKVEVNKNYNLGKEKNIAVKIPATVNAIEIGIKMTVVKNDLLQAKFDLLNSGDYQKQLEITPKIVGQILSITSLVKKLFSDSDPQNQLEASYAGIISTEAEENPVENLKLTKGTLILISTNEGNTFSDVDETKFEIKGSQLYYKNKEVENTYVMFNISFDQLKGEDQNSNWFKKYSDALNNLDKIVTAEATEFPKIFNDSKIMWIEGNALLSADPTYINSERLKIKTLALQSITDKYKELNPPTSPVAFANNIAPLELMQGLTGTTSFRTIINALPATGSFFKQFNPNPTSNVNDLINVLNFNDNEQTLNLINTDASRYRQELKTNNLNFSLGK